jgi:hypothetical protein
MDNAPLTSHTPSIDLSIDSIKHDFIKLNARPAANEQFSLTLASAEHVRQVKVWVQDQERELGLKVTVVAGLEALPHGRQVTKAINKGAPGAVEQGQGILFANEINSHKQAMDAYEYVVVGLVALPRLMAKKQAQVCTQIANNLAPEHIEYIEKRFNVSITDPQLAIMHYLAEVAALAIKPNFVQRRESWQRSWLRKVYPTLAWTATDIHHLIYSARCKV